MGTKAKRQRCVITLTDDPTHAGGFQADIVFEPSIKKWTENSPCANAGFRLAKLILTRREELAEPPGEAMQKEATDGH